MIKKKTILCTGMNGTNASKCSSDVSTQVVDSSRMLQLEECLQLMLPDHLSRYIEIPCNLS